MASVALAVPWTRTVAYGDGRQWMRYIHSIAEIARLYKIACALAHIYLIINNLADGMQQNLRRYAKCAGKKDPHIKCCNYGQSFPLALQKKSAYICR